MSLSLCLTALLISRWRWRSRRAWTLRGSWRGRWKHHVEHVKSRPNAGLQIVNFSVHSLCLCCSLGIQFSSLTRTDIIIKKCKLRDLSDGYDQVIFPKILPSGLFSLSSVLPVFHAAHPQAQESPSGDRKTPKSGTRLKFFVDITVMKFTII